MTNWITQDQTTTIVATTSGDEWIIDTDVNVETADTGIDASGTATGRQFTIKGTLRSIDGPAMLLGDPGLADSGSDIKVDIAATFASGGAGLVAQSGGVGFINVGTVDTVATGLDLRGDGNTVENDGTMTSTTGSVIVTAGDDDSLVNNGTIIALADAIVSTGADTSITNNLSLTSTAGRAIVAEGAGAIITNTDEIHALLDAIVSSGLGATITNNDLIVSSTGAAINSSGDDAIITNNTTLSGATSGILSTGKGVIITNSATVTGTDFGIRSTGNGAVINTTSQLTGDIALSIEGNGASATNSNEIHGLSADSAAVSITAAGKTSFTNTGAVYAVSGVALSASAGAESILNSGSLYGDVRLGGGNDWFSALLGQVTGSVYGGRGNDVYVVGIPLDIVELAGQGNDTVRSRYTYALGANLENLELLGKDDMQATGNRLANRISGNEGDNQLAGLGGRDVFVFETGFGRDVITDFADNRDRVDLSDIKNIDGFSDIAGKLKTSGEDVVIVFGHGDRLTIEDIHKSELSARDFVF